MANELCILSANFNAHFALEIFGLNDNWTLHFANFNVHVGLEIAKRNGDWTLHFVC